MIAVLIAICTLILAWLVYPPLAVLFAIAIFGGCIGGAFIHWGLHRWKSRKARRAAEEA